MSDKPLIVSTEPKDLASTPLRPKPKQPCPECKALPAQRTQSSFGRVGLEWCGVCGHEFGEVELQVSR